MFLGGDGGSFCVGCGRIGGKSGVSNSSCGFAAIRYVLYGVVVLSDVCGGVFVGYIICSNSSFLKIPSSLLLRSVENSWIVSLRDWW